MELQFLISADCLIMVCVFTKLGENILNVLRVMERTRFVTDRKTHRRTDRHLWENNMEGGDIII